MREGGFSFFIFLLVTSSLSLFFLKIIEYFHLVSLDNRIKRQSYLCLKHSTEEHQSVVERLNDLNKIILAGNLGLLSPKTAATAKAAKKWAQRAQLIRYGIFLKKMALDTHCNGIQKTGALKNFPYARTGAGSLERSFDGTLKVKEKKWTLTVPSAASAKVPLSTHILKMELTMKNKYSSNLGKKSSRLATKDILPSRPFFLPHFWPPSISSAPGWP